MIGQFGEGPCGGWVFTHLLWQLRFLLRLGRRPECHLLLLQRGRLHWLLRRRLGLLRRGLMHLFVRTLRAFHTIAQ